MAETVSVTLRLFAVFRETLGSGTLEREVPAGTTVGRLLDLLIAEHPALAGAEAAVSFSVNRSYASADTVLHAGDEVSFIPPVSGGALVCRDLVSVGDPCLPQAEAQRPPLAEETFALHRHSGESRNPETLLQLEIVCCKSILSPSQLSSSRKKGFRKSLLRERTGVRGIASSVPPVQLA